MPFIDRVARSFEQGLMRAERRLMRNVRQHREAQTKFETAQTKFKETLQKFDEILAPERFERNVQQETIDNLQLKSSYPLVPPFPSRNTIQARNIPINGEKFTLKFGNPGRVPMEQRVGNAISDVDNLKLTLQNDASPYVQPKLATHYGKGEAPSTAMEHYKRTVKAFEKEHANLKNLLTPAEYDYERRLFSRRPTETRIGVGVGKHQEFEIRIHDPRLGELRKERPYNADQHTPEQHVAAGVKLAKQVKDALDRARTENLDPILSPKMLRSSGLDQKLTTRGLAQYEEAIKHLTDTSIQNRISHLHNNNIQFKVTHNGISRITQRNQQGQIIHQQEFNGIPRSGRASERSILEGILQALDHGEHIAPQKAPPLPPRPTTSTSVPKPPMRNQPQVRFQSPPPRDAQGPNPQELRQRLERLKRTEPTEQVIFVSNPIRSQRELAKVLNTATNIIGTSKEHPPITIRLAPEMTERNYAKPVFLPREISRSVSPSRDFSGSKQKNSLAPLVPPKHPLDAASASRVPSLTQSVSSQSFQSPTPFGGGQELSSEELAVMRQRLERLKR